MEIIGWIGSILLAFCAVPQAIQSFRQKHSRGVSQLFIIMWLVGELFAITYIFPKQDYPLMFNYSVNVLCLVIICWYKYRPNTSASISGDATGP